MPFSDILGHAAPVSWIQNALQSDHLAHAYLFTGEDAIGKKLTAIRIAQAINCDQYDETSVPDPCGSCRSCHQTEAETHPDFLFIRPEQGKGQNPQIKIERVREIEHHVIYRPLMSSRKICLIDEADRMTMGAANALLKTLEEPPDHCLFILITSRPASLLSTIRSRCLVIRFSPPSPTQVKDFLIKMRNIQDSEARFISVLTNGQLGHALQLDMEESLTQTEKLLPLLSASSVQSIPELLDIAEALSKSDQAKETLSWFFQILRDLLLVTLDCPSEYVLHQKDIQTLQTLATRTSAPALITLLEELHALEQGLNRNLNLQLGFERFLLHLREGIPLSAA